MKKNTKKHQVTHMLVRGAWLKSAWIFFIFCQRSRSVVSKFVVACHAKYYLKKMC